MKNQMKIIYYLFVMSAISVSYLRMAYDELNEQEKSNTELCTPIAIGHQMTDDTSFASMKATKLILPSMTYQTRHSQSSLVTFIIQNNPSTMPYHTMEKFMATTCTSRSTQ
jgi:hypothetical protein